MRNYPLLLTKDEGLAAFWFMLRMLGPEGRGKLVEQMQNNPKVPCIGERELLVRAILQYERDEAAVRDGSVTTKIVGH